MSADPEASAGQAKIDAENLALLTRLRLKKPFYSSEKMRDEWKVNRERFARGCTNPGGPVKPSTGKARASPRNLPVLAAVTPRDTPRARETPRGEDFIPRPPPVQSMQGAPRGASRVRPARRRPLAAGSAALYLENVQLDELQLLNNLNEFEFRNNQKSIQYIVIQDV